MRTPLLASLPGLLALLAAGPPRAELDFRKEVAPILESCCLKCHAGPRARADLRLTTRADLLAGGTTGPALVPGQPDDSLLLRHVRDGKMPPRQPLSAREVEVLRKWIASGAGWEGPDLKPPTSVASTQRAGPDWWSLQPIRRPPLPKVQRGTWVRNPLDAFILAGLEAKGLSPSPEADRLTYIRRVTFDLTGLAPTPEEVEAFLADTHPDAYERLVDSLLASPAYGERYARHWLDVVRFAESHGYEMNTLRPNAWPYRDWVIRAFNRDVPFDTFVREQLAGDVTARGDPLGQAATGFLVAGPHDMVGNATLEGKLQQRADDLADIVGTTGATFLGLTVGCARCHDHKFDPVAQKDFYALQAIFAGVEHAERDLALVDVPGRKKKAEEVRLALAKAERELDALEPLAGPPGSPARRPAVGPLRNVEHIAPIKALLVRFSVTATNDGSEPCIDELEVYAKGEEENVALAARGARPAASSVYAGSPLHRLEHINDGRVGNARSWISAERGRGWVSIELPAEMEIDRIVWGRDRLGVYRDRLARDYRVEVSADGKTWTPVAGSWDRLPTGSKPPPLSAEATRLARDRDALRKELTDLEKPARVYAGTFRAPDVIYRLHRGDVMQKKEEVGPGAVAAVRPALSIRPGASDAERRLALAGWIAHPDNPLTARVLVNRVWQWHFGTGIVSTPSDFGFNGGKPSHPELLDWLASEFYRQGGQLKALHRLIVLSATYRQSSRFDERAARVDAGNRLLWRYTPRRLEAEALRDALLQASGALDRRMGGPGYHLWDYSGYVIVFRPKEKLGPEALRRMVYQFKPRLQQDGTFGAFDCPDATTALPRRSVSTTPLQALNLLNDPFVLDQAQRFARRVEREAGPDVPAQVRRAFALAFGREPSSRECAVAETLVRGHGLPALARALFNANEFVFVH